MSVRRMHPADAAAVASLAAACLDATTSWSERELLDELVRPFAEAWVAGEPIAAFALARFAGEGELLAIATAPGARRRGLAKALVRAVLDAARARGARSVTLEVRADNAPARALYEGEGFAVIDVRRRYYADGADALVMGWAA